MTKCSQIFRHCIFHVSASFFLCIQELQKGLDNHKSEVLSINLRSADFLQTEVESEEAWELRDGLKEMNSRWARLGGSLEDWREELQRALMQCQVAPTVVWSLVAWLCTTSSCILTFVLLFGSNQEFHEMSHGLLLWLENIDRRRNQVVPIPPDLDQQTLRAHHETLTVYTPPALLKPRLEPW